MTPNRLPAYVLGALLLTPLAAAAQDPWSDMRALDAAILAQSQAEAGLESEPEAPAEASVAAPAAAVLAAPRSASVPKPLIKPVSQPVSQPVPQPVPRPMPRPAVAAANPATAPTPKPAAMLASTRAAAPAPVLPASVPLPPVRPALLPAAAPLVVTATTPSPSPALAPAEPAPEPAPEPVPEIIALPPPAPAPEPAPVLARETFAQTSVVRTSVAQDTFASETFAPETFAPKPFVPQVQATQVQAAQTQTTPDQAIKAQALQALASRSLAPHTVARETVASQAQDSQAQDSQAQDAQAQDAQAQDAQTEDAQTLAPPSLALLAPPAPSVLAAEPSLTGSVAGALSLLSVPAETLFPPAQASEVASPGGAHEDAAPPAAGDAPKAGEEASQQAPALPPAPPLYREVRELQRLQDSMAVGVPGALPAQNALIAHIDQLFRAADASAWNDPQNARALVIFALSGGGPGVLRAVLGKSATPNVDERLLRGSLAYLEGREPEALKQLGEVDMRSLPDSLAGQVALAQAALWVRRDPARAAVLLGRARLTAPGTLVEEAALRRAIFIAAQADDLGTFERLTATYLARFRHSVYAGNFRQRFAAALTRMSFIDKPDEFYRINDLLAPLEPASRREIALMVAQGAVGQGKKIAAERAADLVLKGAVFGSLEADRATLYRSAATVASPERFAESQAELASLASERFAPDDARLLGAAQAVAASILHAVDIPAPGPAGGAAPAADPAATDSPAEVADTGPPPATLAKAQAALATADQMLGDAPL